MPDEILRYSCHETAPWPGDRTCAVPSFFISVGGVVGAGLMLLKVNCVGREALESMAAAGWTVLLGSFSCTGFIVEICDACAGLMSNHVRSTFRNLVSGS